ncbi:MAG: hypothetical protein J6O89_01480 [Aeriscardovia sp.]|nr:hypothetical protein [Aeriscardovia sp.]
MQFFRRVTPSLVLYGLWYPGLTISLLLMLALCGYQFVGFLKTFNYSDLESVIFWILGAFWYGLCLVNAYRIRKGKKPALWKEGRKALGTLNASSAFIVPGILIIGMIVAMAMFAPVDQALIGIVPSGIWIAWGVYAVLGMKKNEISIEDFVKEGREAKEGEAKEKKSSRVFKFVTPSFALKYCYYPGLLGGFAVYLVLAGFRGGFDVFSSPTGPNIKGFLWTLLGILLYVWAITNLFKIRGGKNPLFHYSARRAFHAINTRSAVDMPLALIGILWSMGAKAWTITCMVLILLFMAWGIFVEIGCYRNGLVPKGFVKAPEA